MGIQRERKIRNKQKGIFGSLFCVYLFFPVTDVIRYLAHVTRYTVTNFKNKEIGQVLRNLVSLISMLCAPLPLSKKSLTNPVEISSLKM